MGQRCMGFSSSILVACQCERWKQPRMNGTSITDAYLGRGAATLVGPRCVTSPSLLAFSHENCVVSLSGACLVRVLGHMLMAVCTLPQARLTAV